MCVGTHKCSSCECQKEVSDPMKLELQVVVNHLMWMLGTELESCARAASNLNC